jgi:hypothetical protein
LIAKGVQLKGAKKFSECATASSSFICVSPIRSQHMSPFQDASNSLFIYEAEFANIAEWLGEIQLDGCSQDIIQLGIG